MKTLMLVLALVVVSTSLIYAENDSLLEQFSNLSDEQQERADSLIHQFFQSADQSVIGGRELLLEVSETSADNVGWLWSRMTEQLLRSGTVSQEILVYHEVVVDKEAISDIVGHYQQTLLYQDDKFRLLENVWFSKEVNQTRMPILYLLACIASAVASGVLVRLLKR